MIRPFLLINGHFMDADSGKIEPAPKLSRRAVLRLAAATFIGGVAGVGTTAMITRLGASDPPAYRFFTLPEAELVIAICEQLIPADDTPGATETGAIGYIDRQLCGLFANHQSTYRRGLEAFRQTCLKTTSQAFPDLETSKKIEILTAVEAGKVPKELWGDPSPQEFFNLILAHTMQGFYGSPRHGGNRHYASYRMLGLAYPQFVGQNRYRKT